MPACAGMTVGEWRGLDANLIAEAVVPGAEDGEGDSKSFAAGEGVVAQAGKNVEAFGLAGDGFGEDAAEQVGGGDAVAAVAVGEVDGGGEPAHVREAREGEGKIAAPAEVDFGVLQAGEGF